MSSHQIIQIMQNSKHGPFRRIRRLRIYLSLFQIGFFLACAAAIILYVRWDIEREALDRYAAEAQQSYLDWIDDGELIRIDREGRPHYKFPPIGRLPTADDYRDSVKLNELPTRTLRRGRQSLWQSLH